MLVTISTFALVLLESRGALLISYHYPGHCDYAINGQISIGNLFLIHHNSYFSGLVAFALYEYEHAAVI
jgi:hypothetical protein